MRTIDVKQTGLNIKRFMDEKHLKIADMTAIFNFGTMVSVWEWTILSR